MEQRYRWFTISPLRKAQIVKLSSVFHAKAYSRDTKSGFSLSAVRGDLVEGVFTERIDYTEKLTDPLGNEISIPRVEFRRTEFRIATSTPQLEFKNPPRSINSFLNIIAGALDFEIAIEPAECPPLKWALALASNNNRAEIFGFRSSQFSLSNEIKAFVSVVGTRDVRGSLTALLGKRQAEAASVICGWTSEAGDWRIELRSGGIARVIKSPTDKAATGLRKALSSSLPAQS